MTWGESKKIEAVTTYLILGKMPLVAQTIGVPLPTLKLWKQQQWWSDLINEVTCEGDLELDAKLAKRIDKALNLVNDRLDNGDFQYDPKTGSFVRRPVNIRDGWKVASEMIDRRWLIRKQPKEQASQEAVGDILKNLALEFASMAKKKLKDVEGEIIDMETLDGKSTSQTDTTQTEVLNGPVPKQIEEELSEGIRQLSGPGQANPQSESEKPS